MTGIVTVGLVYRPTERPARTVSWVSLALVAAYAANAGILIAGLG